MWEQITLDMIEVKADNETLQNKESTNRILRAFNDANVQSIMRIYENTRGNESEMQQMLFRLQKTREVLRMETEPVSTVP